MSIDVAKSLLKKGIELGDQDLISMANELLLKYESNNEPKKKIKKTAKTQKFKTEDFIIKNKTFKNKKAPVSGGKNQWSDTEALHKNDVTPQVQLTERKRPAFKYINRVCGTLPNGSSPDDEGSGCGKKVKIASKYNHDGIFLCDNCVRQKIKK